MKPIELWMEGLAAFREAQTIDFRSLDDLFVIMGPTGAGKTTILDGLSLALFGELPRANQNQRKDFITLGASEAKVRLDFTAGGALYRVGRKLPRNGSQKVTLHVRQGDEWVPEPQVLNGTVADVKRRIETILGFDYDAFTKAVVLPQGDFAQFLRGAADERRKLLSRLLDCDKYERAGAIARERARDAEREATVLTEVLERDWSDATEERRSGFVEEAHLLRDREATLRELLDEIEKVAARALELRARATLLHARESKASEAAVELEQLHENHATLDEAERITAEDVAAADKAVADANSVLAEAEAALGAAIDSVGDESRLARLQTAAETLKQVDRDRASLEEQQSAADQALRKATEDFAAATETQQIAARAKDAAFVAYDEARKMVAAVRDAVRVANDRSEAERVLEAARGAHAAVGPRLETARQQQEAIATAHQDAERSYLALQSAHDVQALRSSLAEGKPCPVCEQVVAVLPGPGPGQAVLTTAANLVAEARRALDTALTDERDAELSVHRAQVSLDQAEQRLAQLPVPDAVPAANAIQHAEQAERTEKDALDEATHAARSADSQFTSCTATKAAAIATVAGIVAQIDALAERTDAARSTLAYAFGEEDVDAVSSKISTAQDCLRALRKDERDQRKAVDMQTTARAEAGRRRSAHEAVVRRLTEKLVAIRTRLAEEFEAEVPMALATGPAMMGRTEAEVSPAVELAQLAAFCSKRADDLMALAVSAESDADEIERRAMVRLRKLDFELPEGDGSESVVPRTIMALRRWIQVSGEAAAQAEAEAATLARRIEQRKEHEAQIAKLTTTADRHNRLGNELRSDRFIKFVLEESFQELAFRASEELRRVSAGRYSLRAGGYDFDVVDHANADECRSVVTLSGGESFLASLSLALAFAGSIRDLAGDALGARLESVFIDEGFGSLDPEVLDIVADGLERMQEDRRQVGIITHVPSLAARIPSGLKVEPGPNGSSVFER